MTGPHKVHCFGCGASYEQTGPHPQLCGSCGSRQIGVHSDPTGEVWTVVVIDAEGTRATHAIHRSGVGDLVQAVVDAGIQANEAVVITPPEAGLDANWSVGPDGRPVQMANAG